MWCVRCGLKHIWRCCDVRLGSFFVGGQRETVAARCVPNGVQTFRLNCSMGDSILLYYSHPLPPSKTVFDRQHRTIYFYTTNNDYLHSENVILYYVLYIISVFRLLIILFNVRLAVFKIWYRCYTYRQYSLYTCQDFQGEKCNTCRPGIVTYRVRNNFYIF